MRSLVLGVLHAVDATPSSDGLPGAGVGFFGAHPDNLFQVGFVGMQLFDLFAEGRNKRNHIFGQLFFHIAVTDLAGVVEVTEMLVGFGRRERFHQAEEVFDGLGLGLVGYFSRQNKRLAAACLKACRQQTQP